MRIDVAAWALALAVTGCAGTQGTPSVEAPASAGTAGILEVADQVAEFLASRDSRRRTLLPLSEAPDSTRRRWTETLTAIPGAPLAGTDEGTIRALLLESLHQTDAMGRCPDGRPGADAPVGAACYAAWLRLHTALPLTPRQVYDIGVDMRLELEDRIVALAQDRLGVDNSVDARAILTEDPRYRFPSRQAMLVGSVAYLEKARAALPRAFRVVPDDSLELMVVPEEQGRQIAAAAYYNPARPDRPARFYLNTVQADSRPTAVAATAAFHEGWPGHHFQFARHQDLEPLHPAVASVRSTAFVEGWGLYSEQLADELDLYDSPEDRIGYLLHMQDAMVALQVDAGLHAFGWSRQQAIDTMTMVGGRPRGQAEQYADRHLATPGQMVSYLIGYREILLLREEARQRLGAGFDLRDFHEALLAPGPLPLGVVRASMERWMEARERPTW